MSVRVRGTAHCATCVDRHRIGWWRQLVAAVTGVGDCTCTCHDWITQTGHWR